MASLIEKYLLVNVLCTSSGTLLAYTKKTPRKVAIFTSFRRYACIKHTCMYICYLFHILNHVIRKSYAKRLTLNYSRQKNAFYVIIARLNRFDVWPT